MNRTELEEYSCQDLKHIMDNLDLKSKRSKREMIDGILDSDPKRYDIEQQLGEKGKEGTTYLVRDIMGYKYAMKTFKKSKSYKTLTREAELQSLAAEHGVAPKVVETSEEGKYIVMELMDRHLIDTIRKKDGKMSTTFQKQIINLFKTLDMAGVFHGDSNILNYMCKGRKLYMIDYGMAKPIDRKLIKKLGTDSPNLDIMTIGLVVKLKELGCDKNSWSVLREYIADDVRKRYKI